MSAADVAAETFGKDVDGEDIFPPFSESSDVVEAPAQKRQFGSKAKACSSRRTTVLTMTRTWCA